MMEMGLVGRLFLWWFWGAIDLILWTLAVSDSLPFAWSVGCLSIYIVPVMAPAQDKVMGLSTPHIRRIENEENLMVHIAI